MARPFLFENLLPKWNPVTNCFEDVLTPEVSQPSASPVIDDPLRPSPYKDLGREFRNGASEKQIDDDFQVQQAGALQSQSNFLSTLNFGSVSTLDLHLLQDPADALLTKPSNLDRGASFRPPGNELMNHPALNGRPSPGSSLSQACTPEPFNWNSVFEARTMPTSIQSTYTPIKGATALTTIESPIFDEAVEDIDEASASKPSRSVEPLTFASTERDLGSPQRFSRTSSNSAQISDKFQHQKAFESIKPLDELFKLDLNTIQPLASASFTHIAHDLGLNSSSFSSSASSDISQVSPVISPVSVLAKLSTPPVSKPSSRRRLRPKPKPVDVTCDHPGCNRQFPNRDLLRSHRRIHLRKRDYPCTWIGPDGETCDRIMYRKQDLERHVLTHLPFKVFGCSGCGKSFTRRDGLVRHKNRGRCAAGKTRGDDGDDDVDDGSERVGDDGDDGDEDKEDGDEDGDGEKETLGSYMSE